MSFARKIGGVLGELIFSACLGFFIIFVALANFTQYNNIQPLVTSTIESQFKIQQNQVDALYANLVSQCKTSSTAEVMLTNQNVSLNCTDVGASNSSNIVRLISKNIFDQIYYKKYDCSFLDCVRGLAFPQNVTDVQMNQNYQVIISAKSNEFFSSSQIFLIVGIAVGIVLIFISAKFWPDVLKIVGIILILVGIMYFFIPLIKTLLPVAPQVENFITIVNLLLAPIMVMLKYILILGIVLTAAGYGYAFFMKPKTQKNQPM